ncbi:vitamin K epoxide reductase family protein [Flavobacterium adhaerens]|uniref:vitamin K epoxide reductase family protein n=1 Tax=Flavobacterium adhaerens TaxID=3149043 RepID=UPI0032B3DF5D
MENNELLNLFMKYLKKIDISLDQAEFKFQIESHPDYPSLLSYHDALTFFKIENLVAKIEVDDIDTLPDIYISEFMNEHPSEKLLAIVSKDDRSYSLEFENGSKETLNREKFISRWCGLVLIAEKEQGYKASTPKKKFRSLINITILILILIIISRFSYTATALLLLCALGVFLSIEALKESFDIKSNFTGICNMSASLSCESVIKKGNVSILNGLKMTDLSIIFFTGQLIMTFILTIAGLQKFMFSANLIILIVSFPVTIFSMYYQYKIQKQWCPICISIIITLYLQFALILICERNLIHSHIDNYSISLFVLCFILPLFYWPDLKNGIKGFFANKFENLDLIKFKRNYELFRLAIENSEQYNYKNLRSPIFLGTTDTALKITLNTNLFCGYCAKAHQDIEEIINKYQSQIYINVRFNYNPAQFDTKAKNLYGRMLEIYNTDGQQKFLESLGYWFNHKDYDLWIKKYFEPNDPESFTPVLSRMFQQNMESNLLFTPAILIGNSILPKMYMTGDLKYYIADLLEDNKFTNKEDALAIS